MALPVLTPNSPSAGYIAWTSFGIRYGDVSVTIPAGNTNRKYVYWLWNNGAPASALVTADVLPTLTDADLVLFVNRQGIPISVQSANVVEGSIIATESIIGTSLMANTVNADRIMADTISSREIKADSINASELSTSALGQFAAVNGDMDDADPVTFVPAGWTAGFERSGTAPTYAQETAAPLSGRNSVKITLAANSVEALAARSTPVKAGDQLVFGAAFRMSVTGVPVTLRAYFSATKDFTRTDLVSTVPATPQNVYIFDITASGLVARSDLPTPLAGAGIAAVLDGWSCPVTTGLYVTGQITVPNGARYVRFVVASGLTTASPAHTAVWDSVEYAPLVTNARIADGAISARTVQANSITAQAITVGDFTNLIANANMTAVVNGKPGGWSAAQSVTLTVVTAASGLPGLKLTKTSAAGADTYAWASSEAVDVTAGEKLLLTYTTEGSLSPTGVGASAQILANVRSAAGTWSWVTPTLTTGTAGTTGVKSGIFTVPVGATQIQWILKLSDNQNLNTAITFTAMSVRRMISASLIVDGSIDGQTITGATIRTDAVGKRRWELTSAAGNRLQGYLGVASPGTPGSLTIEQRPSSADGVSAAADYGYVELLAPEITTGQGLLQSKVTLFGNSRDGTRRGSVDINAEGVNIMAPVTWPLVIAVANDVTNTAGNTPALIIGDSAGIHVRMDGNEMQAMSADATPSTWSINAGFHVDATGRMYATNVGNSVNFAIAEGTDTLTPPAGGTVSKTITLPAGRFKSTPTIVVSVNSTVPGNVSIAYTNATATNFQVYMYRTTSVATTFSWMAIAT